MYFMQRSSSSSKLDISFCVYLLSYAGFVAYTSQWLMMKIETDERKPHPFFIHGKLVKDSITCNPSEESFETIDPEIHTLTDIRKYVFVESFSLVVSAVSGIKRRSTTESSGCRILMHVLSFCVIRRCCDSPRWSPTS